VRAGLIDFSHLFRYEEMGNQIKKYL
jgi:hypothetical protein